jgi:Tfp pilus assembly protein FimT
VRRGTGFRRQSGYSLVEAVLVVAIVMTLSTFAVINVRSVLKSSAIDAAYDMTLTQMRSARQTSVAERRIYVISFTAPASIQIQRVEQGGALTLLGQLTLPSGIQFRVEPGVPTQATKTPDQFGTAALAIDFNGAGAIYFQPDGSANDSTGRTNNGVIYLARPGDLPSARAVTLFGTTGRIKGWRLANQGGTWAWN